MAASRVLFCEMNDETFYKSKRWKTKRAAILRRDGYMCQESKRYGRHRPANTVHHIFPRESFPEFEMASWNLISLSHEEHNAMHYRETGELTEKGLNLLKRTARKRGLSWETGKPDTHQPKESTE